MKLNRKALYVILTVLLCTIVMSYVDGIIQPQYAVKSLIKLVLFLIVPLGYFISNRNEISQFKSLFILNRRDLLIALLLGSGVFAVIIGAYFLLRSFIDFSGIAQQLTSGAGVNADNFVFVALYISFANSLLEEFFFRGFAFITLKKMTSRRFAYVYSSVLFAAYHVGMMVGWFNIGIWILAIIGLFAGGCIFNYLNEKRGNIYTSWLVHMFANFAINTVGFIMFGIMK